MENVAYVHVWRKRCICACMKWNSDEKQFSFFRNGGGGGGAEFPRPFYIFFYIWKRNKGDVKFN